MKIRSVGEELFHTEGLTDMKAIVSFHKFAKANGLIIECGERERERERERIAVGTEVDRPVQR